AAAHASHNSPSDTAPSANPSATSTARRPRSSWSHSQTPRQQAAANSLAFRPSRRPWARSSASIAFGSTQASHPGAIGPRGGGRVKRRERARKTVPPGGTSVKYDVPSYLTWQSGVSGSEADPSKSDVTPDLTGGANTRFLALLPPHTYCTSPIG